LLGKFTSLGRTFVFWVILGDVGPEFARDIGLTGGEEGVRPLEIQFDLVGVFRIDGLERIKFGQRIAPPSKRHQCSCVPNSFRNANATAGSLAKSSCDSKAA